jgi:hypothetical protein
MDQSTHAGPLATEGSLTLKRLSVKARPQLFLWLQSPTQRRRLPLQYGLEPPQPFPHRRSRAMTASIEQAARELAEADARSEESMVRIYWFPHEKEVRLVEVMELTVPSDDGMVQPFYLRPTGDFPYNLGVALIRPDEDRRDKLPESWGSWNDGVVVFERVPAINGH